MSYIIEATGAKPPAALGSNAAGSAALPRGRAGSAAEDSAVRDAVGARELAPGQFLAILAARAQHLDPATLRRHLEARLGDIGHLAHLADHVGEAAKDMLAR